MAIVWAVWPTAFSHAICGLKLQIAGTLLISTKKREFQTSRSSLKAQRIRKDEVYWLLGFSRKARAISEAGIGTLKALRQTGLTKSFDSTLGD